MSTALALFQALCDVGNLLEALRDADTPCSNEWLMHTEVLGLLDAAVDLLVESEGLPGDNDAP
jgi:hypothetical protein